MIISQDDKYILFTYANGTIDKMEKSAIVIIRNNNNFSILQKGRFSRGTRNEAGVRVFEYTPDSVVINFTYTDVTSPVTMSASGLESHLNEWINTGVQATTTSTEGDFIAFQGGVNEIELGEELLEVGNTGIYRIFSSYLGRINGGDNTKYDLGSFRGHVFDWITDPDAVRYDSTGVVAESTLRSPAFLLTHPITYLYWVAGSGLVERNTAPTDEDYLKEIPLLRIVHTNNTTISAVNPIAISIRNPINQFNTYLRRVGFINNGLIVSNLGNGQFRSYDGTFVAPNANISNDINNSHEVSVTGFNPQPFRHILRAGAAIEGADVTTLNFGFYDNGTGSPVAIGGSNKQATLMRIYVSPQQNWRSAYGQTIYSSLNDAVLAINTDNFVTNPNIPNNLMQVGIMAITKDGTESRFFLTDNQGRPTGASTIVQVSTLQSAYNNGDGTLTSTIDKPVNISGFLKIPEYTVASLPLASSCTGQIIYVSNESGGAVIAFSDGVNWRRSTDRVIVT